MAGTWSTPYASARSRSMARLSTSTAILSESSATSRTSCSFCWQSSAAVSSCEKTTSFTGPAMRSNSLRTAAWSRSVKIGMESLYLLESRARERHHEAVRRESLRADRVPLQLLPRARLLDLRDARAVRRRHQARLRGEGALRDRHRRRSRRPRLHRTLRHPASSPAHPLPGARRRDDDVRKASDPVALRGQ